MLQRALNDLKNPRSDTSSIIILATYNGTDGSKGFQNGQRYEMIVKYIRSRGRFEARTKDGLLFCQYENVADFVLDWVASAIQKGV